MYTFGGKLKTLRVAKKLTQGELSEKLNSAFGTSINKGMISKWENNIDDPSLDNARNIAKFFEISFDELLGLKESEPVTVAAHFDGEEFTDEEMDEIMNYINFVKNKRKEK